MDEYLILLNDLYDNDPATCWMSAIEYAAEVGVESPNLLFWERSKLGFVKYTRHLDALIRR